MIREVIPFESEEQWLELRIHDITSTESAALFGISPYVTLFELYFKKKDKIAVDYDTELMRWGRRLEKPIAEGIAEDFKLEDIRPMKEYIRIPELRMGSSFDYALGDDGILEIKNVGTFAYQKGWLVEGGEVIEAPVWIESQIQHQLFVSGRKYAYIGALIGGGQAVLIKRQRDEGVMKALERNARSFWKSIDENKEPKPDFERDAEYIGSLFSYAEPGKVIELDNQEINSKVLDYKDTSAAIKNLEARKQGVKAELLMMIKDAEKVKGNNWTISAGVTGPVHMEFTRKGFRNFRISYKKKKEN